MDSFSQKNAAALLHRRAFMLAGGAMFGSAFIPKLAFAADGRDPRLVVIILRGALDGLSAVPPLGDPAYEGLRGQIALFRSGDKPALALDNFFALHPAMPVFARLYQARQAAVIHASATSYRARSHFDGQDVLESGMMKTGLTDSGWLNRVIAQLPAGEATSAGKRVASRGLGIGPTTPLILRGAAPVAGWAPTTMPAAEDDLANRLIDLYAQRDKKLGEALSAGLGLDKIAGAAMAGAARPAGGIDAMRSIASGAARLIAADDGPRIAALAFNGWDTHAAEGGATGRLAGLLAGLDGAIEELERGLGGKWKNTAVAVITEFGRTARINGTAGTDHGTATCALLFGGAINGGRVIADWPGLREPQLHEGRDLRPTTDLRAVLKGLLADHLGISQARLASDIFPGSEDIAPMKGLVAV